MATDSRDILLDLFPDNGAFEISAADLRTFVNTVYDEKVGTNKVIDNTNSNSATDVLSANQGKLLSERITNNTNEFPQIKTDIADLQTNLTNTNTSVNTNSQNIGQNTANIVINTQKITNLETSVSGIDNEIVNIKNDITQHNTRITNNETEINSTKSSLVVLNTQLNDTTAQVNLNKHNISINADQINSNKQRIYQLEQQQDLSGDVQQLQVDVQNLKQEDIQINQELTNTNNEVTTIKTDVSDLKVKVNTNTLDISAIKQETPQIETNKNDIITIKNNINTIETNVNSNRIKSEANELNISTLNTNMSTLQTEVTDLSTKVDTYDQRIQTLDTRVSDNTQDITSNRSSITSLTSEVTNMRADLNQNITAVSNNAQNIQTNVTDIANLRLSLNGKVTSGQAKDDSSFNGVKFLYLYDDNTIGNNFSLKFDKAGGSISGDVAIGGDLSVTGSVQGILNVDGVLNSNVKTSTPELITDKVITKSFYLDGGRGTQEIYLEYDGINYDSKIVFSPSSNSKLTYIYDINGVPKTEPIYTPSNLPTFLKPDGSVELDSNYVPTTDNQLTSKIYVDSAITTRLDVVTDGLMSKTEYASLTQAGTVKNAEKVNGYTVETDVPASIFNDIQTALTVLTTRTDTNANDIANNTNIMLKKDGSVPLDVNYAPLGDNDITTVKWVRDEITSFVGGGSTDIMLKSGFATLDPDNGYVDKAKQADHATSATSAESIINNSGTFTIESSVPAGAVFTDSWDETRVQSIETGLQEKVSKTGDTMSGNLTLQSGGDTTKGQFIAEEKVSTKIIQLDYLVGNIPNGGKIWYDRTTNTYKVNPNGVTYDIIHSGSDVFIKKDGSTLLDSAYTPSSDQQVATKKYVDDVANGGTTPTAEKEVEISLTTSEILALDSATVKQNVIYIASDTRIPYIVTDVNTTPLTFSPLIENFTESEWIKTYSTKQDIENDATNLRNDRIYVALDTKTPYVIDTTAGTNPTTLKSLYTPQSDWNATSGEAAILNKPDFSTITCGTF